jgi:hypothetical protein
MCICYNKGSGAFVCSAAAQAMDADAIIQKMLVMHGEKRSKG